MPTYFSLHTYKRPPEEFWKAFSPHMPEFAVLMQSGKTPARCIKSWSPTRYSHAEYFFCLWEAEKPEDIKATLASIHAQDYFSVEVMRVEEFDWARIAEDATEASPA